jgi:hypothetical protein
MGEAGRDAYRGEPLPATQGEPAEVTATLFSAVRALVTARRTRRSRCTTFFCSAPSCS